jgi:hypothetical protein
MINEKQNCESKHSRKFEFHNNKGFVVWFKIQFSKTY